MKKTTSILVVFLFSFLLMTSCGKEDFEEATLSVSNITLELPKEASEKTVSVTTNQEEWTAITNADWISLTQSGTILNIKAAENKTTLERKGMITVFAGGIGRNIEVTQNADEVSIILLPDALEIDQWGGERTFDVNSNTKEWTVSSEVDWIEVTEKQFKNEVVIKIKENESREARTAKLILTGGTKITEFIVKQNGISYYLLPLLIKGSTFKEIQQFELDRKHELELSLALVSGNGIVANTHSKVFNRIEYKISGGTLERTWMDVTDETALTDPAFNTFMKENNFTIANSKNPAVKKYVLKNSDHLVEADVRIAGERSRVSFKFIPLQGKPYPTFKKFPYWFMQHNKATAEDIRKHEAENGGTEVGESKKTFLMFDVKNSDVLRRGYWLSEEAPHVLTEHVQIFSNIGLVFWVDEGKPYITEEFNELMKQEGFTIDMVANGTYIYVNKDNLYVSVSLKNMEDINKGKTSLLFNIFTLDDMASVERKNYILSRDLSKFMK